MQIHVDFQLRRQGAYITGDNNLGNSLMYSIEFSPQRLLHELLPVCVAGHMEIGCCVLHQ